jgi:hypothetical protein
LLVLNGESEFKVLNVESLLKLLKTYNNLSNITCPTFNKRKNAMNIGFIGTHQTFNTLNAPHRHHQN